MMCGFRTACAAACGVLLLAVAPGEALARQAAPPAESRPASGSPAAFGQISGSVLTPSRQPVKGSSVAVVLDGGLQIYGTSTEEDGRYSLRNLKSGVYVVLIKDPGGAVLRKERVNARPLFRNIVDFMTSTAPLTSPHIPTLAPPAGDAPPPVFDLSGLLLDTGGASIPEAWVTVAPVGVEASVLRAQSDAEGRIRLLKIPVGYYRLTVRSLGHVTWSIGPLLMIAAGEVSARLTLLPFPLGQPANPVDLIVPVEPIPPEEFEKKP